MQVLGVGSHLNGIIVPPGVSLSICKWMGTAFVHSLYYCLVWSATIPEKFFSANC